MTIAYTWTFPQLEVQTAAYGLEKVVYAVNYVVVADDGAGHVASSYGSVSVPYVASDTFVLYSDLTQETVQEWVTEHMGSDQVANIENYLSSQIADQIDPPTETLPPPWI
jgi:hypothetical protein